MSIHKTLQYCTYAKMLDFGHTHCLNSVIQFLLCSSIWKLHLSQLLLPLSSYVDFFRCNSFVCRCSSHSSQCIFEWALNTVHDSKASKSGGSFISLPIYSVYLSMCYWKCHFNNLTIYDWGLLYTRVNLTNYITSIFELNVSLICTYFVLPQR